MSSDAPRTPLAALTTGGSLVDDLISGMPRSAGRVLDCMDQVTQAWSDQAEGEFPFPGLRAWVEAVIDRVTTDYGDDLNQPVQRDLEPFLQLVILQQRIRIAAEFVNANETFKGLDDRLKRIEEGLPSRNYAFRDLLGQIRPATIDGRIRARIETALRKFDRQEYKEVVQWCTEAGEALFGLYKAALARHGCIALPGETGAALPRIRAWLLQEQNTDGEGVPFNISRRVEWLLLSMFEVLHYLRNAAHHAPEVESRLPAWQRQRRELMTDSENPSYARLALGLAFQIVLELQALLSEQSMATQ